MPNCESATKTTEAKVIGLWLGIVFGISLGAQGQDIRPLVDPIYTFSSGNEKVGTLLDGYYRATQPLATLDLLSQYLETLNAFGFTGGKVALDFNLPADRLFVIPDPANFRGKFAWFRCNQAFPTNPDTDPNLAHRLLTLSTDHAKDGGLHAFYVGLERPKTISDAPVRQIRNGLGSRSRVAVAATVEQWVMYLAPVAARMSKKIG